MDPSSQQFCPQGHIGDASSLRCTKVESKFGKLFPKDDLLDATGDLKLLSSVYNLVANDIFGPGVRCMTVKTKTSVVVGKPHLPPVFLVHTVLKLKQGESPANILLFCSVYNDSDQHFHTFSWFEVTCSTSSASEVIV